jgi:protein-S-isoprenylcysteine O-methyltransferase Ste14
VNLFKTLIFMFIAPATVTIYLPYWLLAGCTGAPPLGALRYAGLLPLAVGVCIELWCAWDFATKGRGTPAPFDPPKELVVRGLYRRVRNPMYVGVLCILLGEALLFASLTLAAYAVLVFILFNLFVLLYEEPTLRRKFGADYERYSASVPRWLPHMNRR